MAISKRKSTPYYPEIMSNPSKTSAKKIDILIIEDDKFYINIFKAKFNDEGYEIIIAQNGLEGLEAAKKVTPRLVLLDLIMPKKDGFSTLQDLRADKRFKNIPIIVLSNLGQDDDIQKAKSLGATDYMVKANMSLREVVEKVNEYLEDA